MCIRDSRTTACSACGNGYYFSDDPRIQCSIYYIVYTIRTLPYYIPHSITLFLLLTSPPPPPLPVLLHTYYIQGTILKLTYNRQIKKFFLYRPSKDHMSISILYSLFFSFSPIFVHLFTVSLPVSYTHLSKEK